MNVSPEHLPAAEVCVRCREQTALFRRGEPHDDRFCFEMIRRAIVDRDNDCWTALTEIYRDHVVHWCRRAGVADGDIDEMVTNTWGKFWQSYTAEKFASAAASAAALAYLRLCTRSVVMDERRRHGRTMPLPDVEQPLPGDASDHSPAIEPGDINAFWALVDSHLNSDLERLIVHLTYENGLRPSEIQQLYPDLFPTVQDVYKSTRNILDRFRRSRDLAAWLDPDGGASEK